ncbi:hypothetical protein FJ364_01545 [Candidatus Dependentiae bacterium]|nr:hypothetical protein [Candidatus Dependentiae bacterium]
MKNTCSLGKSLLVLSLSIMIGVHAQAFVRDPLFSSFNELFEELDTFGGVRPTKNRAAIEKDLRSQAKKLQEDAKKLGEAADKLLQETEKEPVHSKLEQALQSVRESQINVNESICDIQRSARNVFRARISEEIDKTPRFNLNSQMNEKGDVFIVKATLPGITVDDLKITVNTSDEFGKERQTLNITTEAKIKAEESTTQGIYKTTSLNSARIINGRREELNVENGSVSIMVDLPHETNSDLSEVSKTMTFENNALTLSFPITQKTKKKETILRFNSKKQAVEVTPETKAEIK